MKIKTKITALLASLTFLASCKESEEYGYHHTVGEENNAITLMAGISEGGAKLQTRAGEDLHVPFSAKTQMRLYVEGTWTGKTEPTITQYTNCTTKTATSKYDGVTNEANDIHPLEGYTPMLYWDDYGTADPDNASNRAKGLAVYGVAVEGLSTLPNTGEEKLADITGAKWTSLTWSVKTDGTDVLSKDIIVSNNHGDNSASDKNGIKFEQRTDAPANANYKNNILEYKHMMSKVTFVLKAGKGFTDGKFTSTPEVTLTRNKTGESNTEWCITSGTVNIKEASATGGSTSSDIGTVKLQHLITTDAGVVTEHALIYPGSCFGTNNNDVIASINADGNIFYVTAKAIRNVIASTHADYKTKSGYNYVIKVTIDKTEIHVTATVADWTEVKAQAETPKINVTSTYGYKVDDDGVANVSVFNKDYDLFRSTVKTTGYDEDSSVDGVQYAARYTASNSTWDKTIYWPDHQTHYFFRGVYPKVGTNVTGSTSITEPEAVTTVNNNDVIAVANATYTADTYPSDLAIAIPRKVGTNETFDETCKEAGHTSKSGICATEGTINMNFEHAMSQVEIELKTVDSPDEAKVNINENTLVELVDVYNTGNVKLSDGLVDPTGYRGNYTLANVTGDGKQLYRHSAIVPQDLTFTTAGATTNLRFKITIYKSDSTTEVDDIYYADIAPIKVQEKQQNGTYGALAPITKWESGKHYIYTLTLSKTAIKVTATITDWKEVKASQNIWF